VCKNFNFTVFILMFIICFLWTPAQRSLSEVHYILPMFFYIFLWPLYSLALVNGGSRTFYTWWTVSVIREDTTWIFSWSSLNYRVGQKVTKFGVFSDPTRKRPKAAEYCISEKNLLSTDGCSTYNDTCGELWPTNP